MSLIKIEHSSPDSKCTESPPASKRALVVESPSVQPISRHQNYFDSKLKEFSLDFQWKIENFSYYYYLDENNSNSEQCPVIRSSVFSFPSNDNLKLRLDLKFYPKKEVKNNFGLFLTLCNCDRKEIILKYSFCFLNSVGTFENLFIRDLKNKFSENNSFGVDIPFDFKKDSNKRIQNANEYITGDVLTILCDVSYEDTVKIDQHPLWEQIVLTELEKDVCVELKQNKQLSDVVLVFGVGEQKKEFAVHKAILGARSEVFAAMIDDDNIREKNDNNRVEMTDVDVKVGKELVKYLYGGIPDVECYASKLLPIAEMYKLYSLKTICEGALCFRINPESVGELLLLADIHNAELLKSKCIEYIHCHSICVIESENMKHLMNTKPELYYELFSYTPQNPLHFSPPELEADPFRSIWSYTGSRVIKCLKRWTIERCNANHLVEGDEAEHGHFIESPSFPSSSNDSSVNFTVKLYPHGENADCKDHLSLYLKLKCDEKIKVAVKMRVSIVVKENSAKGYTLMIGKKMSNGESIGWPKFIARKKLMENKELLLNHPDDQLVLLCEVFYIENIDKTVTSSGTNTFAKEHEFIARDLSKFYQGQKLMDSVFVIGEKEFKVHKSIVSARSDVFARMFADTNRVKIEGVDDVDAFEQILALVYGQTDELTLWALKMLPLLDKFELNSLKKVCQLALCAQLNEENVADLILLADKHNATLLKAKAIEYIRSKHSVLTKNHSLKVVQQQNPELFYEILCYKLENWNNLANNCG